MKITGTLKLINETQEFGSNGFKKRETVITTSEQYPQHILIEFIQDKTELLNDFKVGDKVEIDLNLRGREWVNPQGETKYFNTIQGWRITKDAESGLVAAANQIDSVIAPVEDGDEIPF